MRNREVSDAFQLGRGEAETPTAVYKLNPSILSKFFNYKETVNAINTEDDETSTDHWRFENNTKPKIT